MSVSTLLVDARPLDHPTARQRGIGRYVTGLLTGLRDIDAPVVALYGTDAEADVLAATVPGIAAERWGPQTVRRHLSDRTWYLATQLMLHPIPLDPIPKCVTDARLPVAAVMYDVIPYRYPDLYFREPNARRQASLRAPLARTVDALLAISDFAASTAAQELDYPLERISTIGAGAEPKFAPPLDDPRQRCRRVLPVDVEGYVGEASMTDSFFYVQSFLGLPTTYEGHDVVIIDARGATGDPEVATVGETLVTQVDDDPHVSLPLQCVSPGEMSIELTFTLDGVGDDVSIASWLELPATAVDVGIIGSIECFEW